MSKNPNIHSYKFLSRITLKPIKILKKSKKKKIRKYFVVFIQGYFDYCLRLQ